MLELGLQQLWEYVTNGTHDAHLQIHDPRVQRDAREPRSDTPTLST